jgi:hypothetical protein
VLRFFSLLFFTFLLIGNANGQVAVRANISCQDWLESRRQEASVALEHFFIGWINGYAIASNKDIWTEPKPITNDQVFWHIDTYCRQNPSSYAFLAVNDFLSTR